jgi:cytochrome c oxidase subunit 2
MIALLLFILIFVTYIFWWLSFTPRLDRFTIDSHSLEFIWTILPIAFLLLMAFPSLYLLYIIEELSSPVISVKVIGKQWSWEYSNWLYPHRDQRIPSAISSERVISIHDFSLSSFYLLDSDARLILPSGCSIQLLVSRYDVLHRWTVPSLGVKVDACPGRLNYLSVFSPNSGVFYGQCREICGRNHSFMPITLEFLPLAVLLE